MRRLSSLLILGAFGAIVGCDQGVPAPAPPGGTVTGPHGGVAVPLPDDRGYAEVLIQSDNNRSTRARAAKSRPAGKPRIFLFFLSTDRNDSIASRPSDVALQVVKPTGESSAVELTSAPPSDDPTGACQYLSAPGDFDYDELHGEISATLDGQRISVPFALR